MPNTQAAIDFLNSEIKVEKETENKTAVIGLLEGVRKRIEAGEELTEDCLYDFANEMYEATMGEAGYGDTDYCDDLQSKLATCLEINAED